MYVVDFDYTIYDNWSIVSSFKNVCLSIANNLLLLFDEIYSSQLYIISCAYVGQWRLLALKLPNNSILVSKNQKPAYEDYRTYFNNKTSYGIRIWNNPSLPRLNMQGRMSFSGKCLLRMEMKKHFYQFP